MTRKLSPYVIYVTFLSLDSTIKSLLVQALIRGFFFRSH